jgi:CubicO group peptidase (beta-lactamase class C family)
MRYAILVLLASCAAPPPAADPELRGRIDPIVRKDLESGKRMGIAVGVLKDGRASFFGYGRISSQNEASPDGDTVFEIGSITKAFTGILLAQLSVEGLVSLDDPVRKHLSANFSVPSRAGREITLLHLATHRSGLPCLPENVWPKDLANPYADYTVEHLKKFLAVHALRHDPGERYEYSNLGAGLLGLALATRAGRSYEELVRLRICDPWGMVDTRIALSDEMKRRLAPGHTPDGGRVANWDIPTLAGCGALRSTANDMLKFLAANLGDDPEIRLSHAPCADVEQGMKIGLGWHLIPAPGELYVWHNGGTGGYRSYAGFAKEKRLGVVVLSNTSEDVDALAMAILMAIAG